MALMLMMMLWCCYCFLGDSGLFVLGMMGIQFGFLLLREAQLLFPSRSISTCLPPGTLLFLSAASVCVCLYPCGRMDGWPGIQAGRRAPDGWRHPADVWSPGIWPS